MNFRKMVEEVCGTGMKTKVIRLVNKIPTHGGPTYLLKDGGLPYQNNMNSAV